MAYQQHRQESQSIIARCGVITLSDTRTQSNDISGKTIRDLLMRDGHEIAHYQIVRDEPDEFEPLLMDLLDRADVHVILTSGGTGISRRDQTIEVIPRQFVFKQTDLGLS